MDTAPEDAGRKLACMILIDERGRLLLQERDDQAPTAPGQWGMCGGHVEPGEAAEDAAYRELEEETGIVLERGHLYLWREELVRHTAEPPGHFAVYIARVDGIEDSDIVLGEGRRIVFVEPQRVAHLDLAPALAYFSAPLLGSEEYRRLAALEPGQGQSAVAGDRSRQG